VEIRVVVEGLDALALVLVAHRREVGFGVEAPFFGPEVGDARVDEERLRVRRVENDAGFAVELDATLLREELVENDLVAIRNALVSKRGLAERDGGDEDGKQLGEWRATQHE